MNTKLHKLKVLTAIGTRPEIIRLSEVIKEFDRRFEHILVHTGQNYDYELNEIFFKELGLRKPDYVLGAGKKTDFSPVERTGFMLAEIDPILRKETPDAFLVLGDTNSALSSYAAKRQKIPVFHMEAGNRCFDERVPEEVNRRVVDHVADINMVYSERARDNLIAEGFPRDRIILTGSPMREVIEAHQKEIDVSDVLSRLSLKRGEYFVVSCHREENVAEENQLKKLADILSRIADAYRYPIIFSAHPRTRAALEKSSVKLSEFVQVMKPLGFFDFMQLEQNAYCTLSDSGTISEESSILDFPALNIREAHERQEAMDEGSVMMVGLNPDRVMEALSFVRDDHGKKERTFRIPDAYASVNVSKKAARILLGYTDYVNRKVWMKDS
ncbi:MAG: UDP-N-acetylglucosamine 2-epimerase (non-hydrolyzing) [bacterium]|nr:UDP-N-acetylglucosamine 2-epimerase (non-hydrolyzing) [bacterium]